MRIYLATSYRRKKELQKYAQELETLGHVVVSRWLAERKDESIEIEDVSERFLKTHAENDLEDINSADLFVIFTKNRKERGGMYVEEGYARARGMKIFLVGPRIHIFHFLADVQRFDNFGGFVEWIKE